MADADAFASVLVDHALAELAVPIACPCDFGPGGRYRLEELIGTGRASHVYRATDRHLSSGGFDSTVAIKISTRGDGLRRDALAARRVAHPHVLSVLDQGIDDYGQAYVVAEYLGGGDLSAVAVPLSPRDAARMVAKLARGVHAMHSAGVVHCDLKPSNILLTNEGEPKLADFDLARWEAGGENERRGNLAFMSPEQFRGEEHALTPPSDVYALGGLLLYLLTGRLPHGATPEQVAASHRAGLAPEPPGAGRDLDAITTRALARRREDRYHSAAELADDLDRWIAARPLYWTDPGVTWRTRLWVRRRPLAAGLVVASIVTALSASAALVSHLRREAELQREANRRAQEMVENLKERVRAHIRWFASTALGSGRRDLTDAILPNLVWLEYLADFPVLRETGEIPIGEERERLMRTLLESLEADGRGGHLDALLARQSLAYILIDAGESEEPLKLLNEVRDQWQGALAPDDHVWLAVRSMEECARANAAIGPSERTAAAARLADIERDLNNSTVLGHVARLAGRIRARILGEPPPNYLPIKPGNSLTPPPQGP